MEPSFLDVNSTSIPVMIASVRPAFCSLALAAVLIACGDDPMPAAQSPVPTPTSPPVTPIPAAATATHEPTSQSWQAFPSTIDGYTRLVEQDPAGLESMIDENIATLNEVIKKDASASDAYVKRGAARVFLYAYTSALRIDAESLLELAVEDFTTAIDLDQSNASAYIGRGEAYDQWKQMEEAFHNYEAAIKLLDESLSRDSQSVDALTNRAYAYSGMDEYDEVIQDLDAAIEIDPGNPSDTHQSLVGTLVEGRDRRRHSGSGHGDTPRS